MEKTRKKQLILMYAFLLISFLFIIYFFFYLENRIYEMNYESWPGDCGQFVIWQAALYLEKNLSLLNLSLNTNPLSLFTGPLTIKKELKKLGIETTFYNNFSIQKIKEKLDEKKPVIVMVNIDSTNYADAGLTHYILVFDYKENDSLQGFYFVDSYYFLGQYEENETQESEANKTIEPIYTTVEELEEKRQNVMQSGQFVGKLQDAINMHKFAIVVGEAEEDRDINKKMMNVFKLQYYAEKIAAFIGKIIIKISKRV